MVNEKVINHIAGKFLWSGLPFEELKAEAYTLYLEAERKYDPTRTAQLGTFVWKSIYGNMKVYVYRELDWRTKQRENDFAAPSQEQGHAAFEITESLSKEAKMVCSAIFSAPGEYMSLMPKMARGKLVKKFRGEGWSWPQIWRVFNEIKSALN